MRLRALVCVMLFAVPARAQDLMRLLDSGPVVMVKVNDEGRFESAQAVIHIRAPRDAIWRVATDFVHYKEFMPKLLLSDTKVVSENVRDVAYEVEVPGVNPEYIFRYTLDPQSYSFKARWMSGDIKHSFLKMHLVSLGSRGSLIYYTLATRNFSALLEAIEDEQQTITVGINVAAAIATVKAIKRRAESH